MSLNKDLVRGMLTGGFFLTTFSTASATQGPVQAEAIMTLKASFSAPRCQLNIPPVVNLGMLSTGEKISEPFMVSINCPTGAANTVLYAMGVNLVSGSNGEKVSMVNVANNPQAELWLKESGVNIKLDKSKPFCDGRTVWRQCQLTPVTYLKKGTPPGEIYATINFSIVYP
ncbi:hypothetical protein V6973_004078 [Salmonella enterica]